MDKLVGTFLKAVLFACLIGVALIAVGCASGPVDKLYAEQAEQERVELYHMWREMCSEAGGYIQIGHARTCNTTDKLCVPSKVEWNGYLADAKNGQQKLVSNSLTYRCVRR